VSVEGSLLRIAAAPGEANQVAVGQAGSAVPAQAAADPGTAQAVPGPGTALTVTDAGTALTPGPGCAAAHAGVTCVTPEEPGIDVSAGDGDDSVTIGVAIPAHVDGGAGDDVIAVRGGASDSVWCARGRDSVSAETLDFLDLGCERVDYGPPGVAGRIASIAGGGRWVPVPGQTWALVDRRILPDVLYLIRRYRVRITEGYGTVDHVHYGEHPLGLAVDIEPGAGGTWADVSRLARWAEPLQNRPRRPFRWVGWNGDFNHGHPSVCRRSRGCAPHLHLSWSHSPTPPRHIARRVWVFDVRGPAP
jgi:hypothetical protein